LDEKAREILAQLVERLRITQSMDACELARRIGAVEGAAHICFALGLIPQDLAQRCVSVGTDVWKSIDGGLEDNSRLIVR
jgi:hypothetical protein